MKNIIAVVTEISTSHIQKILRGIQKCCEESGCNLFIFMCERRFIPDNKHDLGEYMVFQIPDFSEFDGAIIISSTIFSQQIQQELTERIRASGIPAVSLEQDLPGMYNLCIDNKAAMKKIVEHMIHVHGYRRINFVAGHNITQEASERFNAYKEVLAENGIPFESERVFAGDYLKNSGERAAEAFLASPLPFPEAIVCANDVMAFGVYNVLTRHGLMIPEDVALSGFDDDYAAMYHIPSLTSVERRQSEQGYLACRALITGLAKAKADTRLNITTRPVFRRSCGCKDENPTSEAAFRKLHFTTRDMNEKYMAETRAMAIALTTVDSFAKLKTAMREVLPDFACRSFDLYLYDKLLAEENLDIYQATELELSPLCLENDDRCSLMLRYKDGVFTEDLHEDIHDFVRSAASFSSSETFVVSPVHFTDQFFGYCVVGGSTFSQESELYYSWVMNIGNTIEGIRRHRLMKKMIDKLEQSWCYDDLTEVYNRKGFQKYGGRVWRESVSKHKNVLLLFIDLDGLKAINDNYGHDTGDHCIKALASILRRIRCHGEAIMRYGGDEFVIIASDVTEEYAKAYIERIEDAISQYNTRNILPYRLSASIGANILLPDAHNCMDEAIDLADRNMYEIKKEKRKKRQ